MGTTRLSGGFIDLREITTPPNPATDVGRLYVKDLAGVRTLFFRDSVGNETDLLGGGGEVNTASNVGAGEGLAVAKVGVDLPFKSITAGTNITLTGSATELEIAASGGSGNTFARVVKKVDESITSSNTLQDDDELFFTPTINKTYWGFIIFYVVSGATPDYRYSFTLPTGATGEKMVAGGLWRNDVQATQDITNAESEPTNGLLQTFTQYFRIIMGSTPGDVNFQFSQQTIDAGATITKQGSTLVIYEETA